MRLGWKGNCEAQRQSDVAYAKLLASSRKRGGKRKEKSTETVKRDIPYQEYLQTRHWKKKRAKTKKRVGNKCERCGATDSMTDSFIELVRNF